MQCSGEGGGVDVLHAIDRLAGIGEVVITNKFTGFTTGKAKAGTTAGWNDLSGAVATFTDGKEDYGFIIVGFGAHVENVGGIYVKKSVKKKMSDKSKRRTAGNILIMNQS